MGYPYPNVCLCGFFGALVSGLELLGYGFGGQALGLRQVGHV